ncbi:uncharacterized protein LOC123194031 [Mangifera indica]|uniref:uncharacterized protein LOC123194031 n=1 Tax=Mangifera indica TaxID=29780 RepID=UPI001CFBAE70|nr:uncharacterized protein LOC123194031 [Mangifera indica]
MRRAGFLLRNNRNKKMKMGCLRMRKKVKFANFSVQRNLSTLRRIIPGCEKADTATLFHKSIEHIVKLKFQVHILRSLTNYYGI